MPTCSRSTPRRRWTPACSSPPSSASTARRASRARWPEPRSVAEPARRSAAPAPPTRAIRPAPTATATAAHVASPRADRPGRPALRLVEPAPPRADAPSAAADVLRRPGAGEPLRGGLVGKLESAFGVDLTGVRVHLDPRARKAAASLGARAFTAGGHIFLGERGRPDDDALMAHEVAHVLQQRGDSGLPGGLIAEREAAAAGRTAAAGGAVALSATAATGVPQHDDEEPGWVERQAWSLLERVAPDLVPIVRQGVVSWLGDRLNDAIDALMETIMAPVRQVTGVIETVRGLFNDLIDWMKMAGARLAKGDCGALSEAAAKIQQVIEGLASPVIDKIKDVAMKVKAFFTDLWDRFGAPAWDFLKRVGGAVWSKIEQFATKLWEKTQPVRDWLARAWTWLKNKLGVGEGPEGQNGLLQWVQAKAGAAWDAIKAKVEPYKKQLMVVAGVLVLLSPAGPIIVLGAAVGGLIYGVRWISQHMGEGGEAVVNQRTAIERTIMPPLLQAIGAVSAGLNKA